jgi:hypothetical protein
LHACDHRMSDDDHKPVRLHVYPRFIRTANFSI